MVVLKVCVVVCPLAGILTIPLNQLYSTLSAATCVMALLCFGLPGTPSFDELTRAAHLNLSTRIPAWEEGTGHRTLHIPQHRLDSPLPITPLHPPHIRSCRRGLQGYARERLGHPSRNNWSDDGVLVAVNPPPCLLRASIGWKAAVVGTVWMYIVVSPQSFFVVRQILRGLQSLSSTCCIPHLLYCPSIHDIPSSRPVLSHGSRRHSYGTQIRESLPNDGTSAPRRTAAHKPRVCSSLSWR